MCISHRSLSIFFSWRYSKHGLFHDFLFLYSNLVFIQISKSRAKTIKFIWFQKIEYFLFSICVFQWKTWLKMKGLSFCLFFWRSNWNWNWKWKWKWKWKSFFQILFKRNVTAVPFYHLVRKRFFFLRDKNCLMIFHKAGATFDNSFFDN